MDQNNIIESGGFYFIHNFDSGNLGHVERVPTELIAPCLAVSKPVASDTPDYEFNLWTRPDCAGTEYENGNRTWFYFGVQANEPNVLVRLNLINLNKQGKMYSQGMAPVTRTLPGKPQWERIRDRPVHSVTDDNSSTLSFKYRTADNIKATTFFAFTYPFSFAELQIALNTIDLKILPLPPAHTLDDIYYSRECLVYSLEGRRVDLLTISSYHGISMDREERLKHLFPDNQERPYKFTNKKVIFMSARVHPGETPSSFVFNGFLNLLLTRHDPIALQLRKLYVFKMIPFLNPDGVARGHYRTDTRGVNLNRVYLNPSLTLHPTVYASRSLIRYYHFGCEKDDVCDDSKSFTSRSIQNISESSELIDPKKKKVSNPKAESGKGDKSATNSKAPSTDTQQLGTETSTLAEQVCDLKLGESPSSTSPSSPPLADTPSLLNESTLRTCLGSAVHLSTSEELNFQGANPLRPLRDTLKNSISLLMESNSSITADSLGVKDSRLNNLKMGWCRECRQSMAKAEDSIAASSGFGSSAPGRSELFHAYHNTIQEYREHQRKQLDDEQRRQLEAAQHTDAKDDVHLCTNCFKKFAFNGSEEIRVADSKSTASVGVSAGDSGSVRDDRARRPPPGSTGDAAPEPPAVKEDKPKGGKARRKTAPAPPLPALRPPRDDSGLYLYIDLHGHASKKGIFMYGNHFEDLDNSVECMLLPRIMSLNNLHFHFSSCNFTERNMYLKDRRDGMSREGSGRVAVLKATGLVRSYTLECNYNTGRMVNVLPPAVRDIPTGGGPSISAPLPPKYTPHVFEEMKHTRLRNLESFEEMDAFEVGRSLGASILDLTGHHPNSRVPCSEHRTLSAVRDWLRAHTKTMRPQQLAMSRLRARGAAAAIAGPPGGAAGGSPPRVAPFGRVKPKVTEERKENAYAAARPDSERKPVLGQRSGHDIIAMNVKYARKPEAALAAARPKYLAESEPKPKSLAAKRRSVLAIRKPNGSKTQVGGAGGGGGGGGKPRGARRAADDSSPRGRASVGKRGLRGGRARPRCRAMASSSSDDMLAAAWEDVAGGTALQPLPADSLKRRVFPAPAPHLKKIRLKTAI